jgi:LysM repeat protein
VVVATALPGAATHPNSAGSAHAGARKLPPYWKVNPGDTLAQISSKTGLTVGQLEAYNPNVDPQALIVGQRVKLWAHPPVPRLPPAKPLGPLFWTVRVGQSFGSIAAATGINLARLEQLNPRLPPSMVQPGDRITLRPESEAQQATILARLREGRTEAQP